MESKHGKDVAKLSKKSSGKKATSKTTKKATNKKELSDNERKEKQLEIIKKNNAMTDDYHTGIRKVGDIKTAKEAFKTKISEDDDYLYPDFKK